MQATGRKKRYSLADLLQEMPEGLPRVEGRDIKNTGKFLYSAKAQQLIDTDRY